MKVLTKIKMVALRVWRAKALKYVVVCVIGVLTVGFLDENSAWSHVKYQQRIAELDEEIAAYRESSTRDQAQIRALDRNPKAMEKIARERYFMKADDEDIFVLSDDDRAVTPTATDHATIE